MEDFKQYFCSPPQTQPKPCKKSSSNKKSQSVNTFFNDDPYTINTKLEKELKKVKNMEELDKLFPYFSPNIASKTSPSKKYDSPVNKQKSKISQQQSNIILKEKKFSLSPIKVQKSKTINDKEKKSRFISEKYPKFPETTISIHPDEVTATLNNKIEATQSVSFANSLDNQLVDISGEIEFEETIKLSFNADLILKNKKSKGLLFLGSNSYKYNIANLNHFDSIFNVIGEFPEKEFDNSKFQLIESSNIIDDIHKRLIKLENHKEVLFIVKESESMKNFNLLCEILFNQLSKGDSILVHCEQGLVRSATLMLFFLRKYFFTNIKKANEFISKKRIGAESPNIFLPIIEKLVKI